MKKRNGWLYAFWIAFIVILVLVLAAGLILWTGSGSEEIEENPDEGGAKTYDNTLSFEAEDAYLMNAVASTTSNLLKTEDKNDSTGTCVANFKTAGDMIVFQINAASAVENVEVALTASYTRVQLTTSEDFVASEHGIFYLNGMDSTDLVTLSGTLDHDHSYGELTATISLQKGINYLILTCTSAEANSMGFMNVDKIDLSWDGEATVEEVSDYTGEVFEVDATGAATLEAEEASLFNSMDSSAGSTAIIGTEQTTLTDGVITNVKNFNTAGDKIVFQINAAAAVNDATIDVIACNGATFGGTFGDNDKILTVNGGEPIELEGTLTNSAFNWTSYGALSGTISLQKGINYIEITAASTASAGYLNVDRIDLNGGTGASSLDATEVSSATELAEALEDGGEIALTADIEIEDKALTVSDNTTLDLAGNTLSTGETLESAVNTIEVSEGVTLTIADSGASGVIENTYSGNASDDNAAAIYSKGDVVIESGTIKSDSIGIKAEGGSVTIDGGTIESDYYTIWEGGGTVEVTIENGATIKGEDKGIYVGGDAKFGYEDYQEDAVTTLNISGGTISCTNDSAICTLGTASADSAIVNISGGVITGAENLVYADGNTTVKTTYPAVYIPSGTLTISGGSITGITAVEIRGGTASITGGTLAVYEDITTKGVITNSSGATSYGYQLCVNPYGVTNRSELGDYSDSISVTVSANVISDVTDETHETVYVSSNITLVTASDGSFKIAKMTKVSNSTDLFSAVAQGGKVALSAGSGSEIDVCTSLSVSADTELDLMGNTLSTNETLDSSMSTVEVSSGATLTIVDTSADGSGTITNTYNPTGGNTSLDNAAAVEVKGGGSLVIESGTIESSSVGIRAEAVTDSGESKATITIDGGTIESKYFTIWGSGNADITINDGTIEGENKGIVIAGDDKFGYDSYQSGTTTLNVTGGEISCEKDSAICTLGNTDGSTKVINISGGTITGPDLVADDGTVTPMPAVYNASGNLTITGGTITGSTAVEHRGGELTISGGTLVCNATGEQNTPQYNSSGATSYGYALTIYPYSKGGDHTGNPAWNETMVVSVTGGTITGDVYVADNVLNGTDSTEATVSASISISGEIVSGDIKIADGSSLTVDDIVK